MESIPPLGEPSSWGSPLLFSLTTFQQAEYAWPAALLSLFFICSLAVTAAMASFQQFCNSTSLNNSKTKVAPHLQQQLQEPEHVLAAGVFLNTTLYFLIAFCAFSIFSNQFTAASQYPWLVTLGLVIALAIVLQMGRAAVAVWAEKQEIGQQPSLYAIIKIVRVLGSPFVAVFLPLQAVAERTRQAFGAPSVSEELANSLDQAPNEPMSPQEKGLLKAIVNFSSITVRQIMRSRVDVVAFQRRMPFPALIKQIQQHGYSRIPVFTDALDKINGVLYVKDLLPYLDAPADFVWQNLIRTPYFIPETQKIDDLLREFQERRVHMAIVVNEYGDTTGLLTLEDVIEEIVGEIHDELDEEEDHYYTQLDEHTFLFEGRTSLHDFCKIIDPPAELLQEIRHEVESVAGLMLRLFSRIPHTGEEVQLGPYLFKIEAADSKKIKKVRVHEIVPHPNHDEE